MADDLRILDIFSGAGGLSIGFDWLSDFSFTPVRANDCNRDAANTYNENFGNICHNGDIADILDDPKTKILSADIVICGPPCQGLSLLNKKERMNPEKNFGFLFSYIN